MKHLLMCPVCQTQHVIDAHDSQIFQITHLNPNPTEAGMTFICAKCQQDQHDGCAGETWCDCQHRPTTTDGE